MNFTDVRDYGNMSLNDVIESVIRHCLAVD